MPQADQLTDAQIRQIVAMIAEQKQAFATGIEGLYTLKKVLEHAVHRMGIAVEWDPSTPPAVRDRFAIVSLSALQWSFGGAALGLMIGVFTERPALWAAGGAAIAAIVGGVQGHEAPQSQQSCRLVRTGQLIKTVGREQELKREYRSNREDRRI